jgi:hypothetical protein
MTNNLQKEDFLIQAQFLHKFISEGIRKHQKKLSNKISFIKKKSNKTMYSIVIYVKNS